MRPKLNVLLTKYDRIRVDVGVVELGLEGDHDLVVDCEFEGVEWSEDSNDGEFQ